MDNIDNKDNQLNDCLFFSSCKLSRVIGKIAEDEFKITGLSPSHAFLLHIVYKSDGIHQKKIGELLHMTPSTITRFIEKLESKGLILKKAEGKNVYIFITEKGKFLLPDIEKAWHNVYEHYSKILTPEESEHFVTIINKLISNLDGKE